MCVCMCVCVRERERGMFPSTENSARQRQIHNMYVVYTKYICICILYICRIYNIHITYALRISYICHTSMIHLPYTHATDFPYIHDHQAVYTFYPCRIYMINIPCIHHTYRGGQHRETAAAAPNKDRGLPTAPCLGPVLVP